MASRAATSTAAPRRRRTGGRRGLLTGEPLGLGSRQVQRGARALPRPHPSRASAGQRRSRPAYYPTIDQGPGTALCTRITYEYKYVHRPPGPGVLLAWALVGQRQTARGAAIPDMPPISCGCCTARNGGRPRRGCCGGERRRRRALRRQVLLQLLGGALRRQLLGGDQLGRPGTTPLVRGKSSPGGEIFPPGL
jgi:hypothetical protein